MSARDDYAVRLLREQEERLQHEASEAEDRATAAWKLHQGLVAKLESVREALFALGTDPDAAQGGACDCGCCHDHNASPAYRGGAS